MVTTHLHDLPEVILSNVFALVTDTRSRNAISLVCTKWQSLERSTRTSLALRGNIQTLNHLPNCFQSVTNLDLSLLSPWGHSFIDSSDNPLLLAQFLRQAFPSVTSLIVYVRSPATLKFLSLQWPKLRHVKIVRWHSRSRSSPVGSDLMSLFENCPSLSTLDLSHFYCWTEDIPPPLQAYPLSTVSLSTLDLLSLSSTDGYKSNELFAIVSACPNLRKLLVPCMFHPRFMGSVGDKTLLVLASKCPRLSLLHLADPSSLSNSRPETNPVDDGFAPEDAMISRTTLEDLFAGLPLMEELTLDICHNVRDTGPALELLNSKCPRLKSLKLGHFHGICEAIGSSQLNGIALCKNLESLSIKNSADLTDSGLMSISLGCPRLVKFEIQGCNKITETGMKALASALRRTLIEVKISFCKNLDAVRSLRALEPIRDKIQRLHIDCVWENPRQVLHNFDLNELVDETSRSDNSSNNKKKCKYSTEAMEIAYSERNGSGFWCRTWERLRYLSLWIGVGEFLTPLAFAGLENCPVLEEIKIKVEGDCRRRPNPELEFGLVSLSRSRYPRLSKMKLDCGDVIGYALTAPAEQTDLNSWERFYLNGIGSLNLYELDYWPPQDSDYNKRSLTLPGAGLLGLCATLRKLFIHGTASEHFLRFLVNNPNLRDVQLREDYYPAPENDMSTEMRADSCSRFEKLLNGRRVPVPD